MKQSERNISVYPRLKLAINTLFCLSSCDSKYKTVPFFGKGFLQQFSDDKLELMN